MFLKNFNFPALNGDFSDVTWPDELYAVENEEWQLIIGNKKTKTLLILPLSTK